MDKLCFHAFLYISKVYDAASKVYETTKEAILNARAEVYWVISSPNTYPSVVNDLWYIEGDENRIFYPTTHKFYKTSDAKASLDIVIATVNGKTLSHNLSSFLYKVSWLESNPPSLYELVLLSLMSDKMYIPHSVLADCSLAILTSEADELIIPLNSELAKKPFRGWAAEDDLKID